MTGDNLGEGSDRALAAASRQLVIALHGPRQAGHRMAWTWYSEGDDTALHGSSTSRVK